MLLALMMLASLSELHVSSHEEMSTDSLSLMLLLQLTLLLQQQLSAQIPSASTSSQSKDTQLPVSWT
jgi:hypothetical protein